MCRSEEEDSCNICVRLLNNLINLNNLNIKYQHSHSLLSSSLLSYRFITPTLFPPSPDIRQLLIHQLQQINHSIHPSISIYDVLTFIRPEPQNQMHYNISPTDPSMSHTLLILLLLTVGALGDCAFLVDSDLKPYVPTQEEVHGAIILASMCEEWVGKNGCCNANAYIQTQGSFKKIDTIFASSTSGGSGGCDLCAINLKRFWCEYACNPEQTNFVTAGEWKWVPSFDHAGEQVFVQQIYLAVESSTACRLFESCQRTSYAAQLSALQSPAGFLNFQGTNAIEDATQLIYINFTNDKTKGLYMEDIDNCSVRLPFPPMTYRGFEVISNCTCNTCESECSGGNFYEPTPIMEGFNSVLVGGVWGGVLVLIAGITAFRYCMEKRKME